MVLRLIRMMSDFHALEIVHPRQMNYLL